MEDEALDDDGMGSSEPEPQLVPVPDHLDQFHDEEVTALRLNVTLRQLRDLRVRRVLGYVKIGSKIRFTEAQIAEFIALRTVPAISAAPFTPKATWTPAPAPVEYEYPPFSSRKFGRPADDDDDDFAG